MVPMPEVSDNERMPDDGSVRGPRVVAAIAGLLAVVLISAVGVASLGGSTAGSATVLASGEATVTLLGGSPVPLAVGEQVPDGAVVDAGAVGAVLRTRERDTWLGGASAVTVVDGARQVLETGFAMVDARRGPELELDTPAGAVTTPAGTVSRVERGSLLRVGTYSGEPVRVRAADRRATTKVPRDHQVQVPLGGLPGPVTPLVLTPRDAYERALATDLVLADEALNDVARRLDAQGAAGTAVLQVLAVQLPDVPAPAVAAPASERSLAFLLAEAGDDTDLRAGYASVRDKRSLGGSWGVVASLVGAEVVQVAARLDALLTPTLVAQPPSGEELDLAALLAGEPAAVPAPAPGPPSTAPGPVPPPPPAGGSGGPAPPTGTSPAPAPPAEPQPEPSPADPVGVVVDTVVDAVEELLEEAPVPVEPPPLPPLPPLEQPLLP